MKQAFRIKSAPAEIQRSKQIDKDLRAENPYRLRILLLGPDEHSKAAIVDTLQKRFDSTQHRQRYLSHKTRIVDYTCRAMQTLLRLWMSDNDSDGRWAHNSQAFSTFQCTHSTECRCERMKLEALALLWAISRCGDQQTFGTKQGDAWAVYTLWGQPCIVKRFLRDHEYRKAWPNVK